MSVDRSEEGSGLFSKFLADLNPRVAGFAPAIGLVLMVWAVFVMMSVADWRLSAAPWLLGVAILCLTVCCAGLLSVRQPDPRRSVLVGVGLTVLSLLGLASFPFAVGIGGVLGIDEDAPGILALIPLAASGFAIVATAPALATTAVGVGASGLIPRWGVWALWLEAPLLPLTVIAGGFAEPALVVGFILIPLGWVVIGASLLRITPRLAAGTTR
jgi:hypothetical protein